jgi:hypothetical protein
MSENRTLYIEEKIINAVKLLFSGKVNDILREMERTIPLIEFSGFQGGAVICPVISFSSCEQSEKERIIRLDVYSLTITLSIPETSSPMETSESELYCYAYSGAIGRSFYDDPTLGGFVDRAVITGKKYVSPKKSNCGESWGLVISVRITVEEVEK